MEVGIPQLRLGLVLEPRLIHEKTEYHATLMLLPAGFFSRLNDLFGQDPTVWSRDQAFLHLAGNAFLDQVSQTKTDLGYIFRGNCRFYLRVAVMREHYRYDYTMSANY